MNGGAPRETPLPGAQVHERVAPIVRRMVWTMIGPDAEFNDITHDAFVRILQGLPRLRDFDRLEQWAARVTINTVNNALRRRRYRRVASWDPQTDPDVLVGHTDFDSRHVAKRVARILAHLPEKEQALLELRWFGSTTIDDIARDADCSPRTVKRRIQRALHRFERNVKKDAEVTTWLSDDVRPNESDADDE